MVVIRFLTAFIPVCSGTPLAYILMKAQELFKRFLCKVTKAMSSTCFLACFVTGEDWGSKITVLCVSLFKLRNKSICFI